MSEKERHLWILNIAKQRGSTKQAASFTMTAGGTIEEENLDDGTEPKTSHSCQSARCKDLQLKESNLEEAIGIQAVPADRSI